MSNSAVTIVIETPKESRLKFKLDPPTGSYKVDRVLPKGLRFMTRVLQPAVSLLMPIDRPLFDAVDSFWAVRLSLNVVLDGRPVRGSVAAALR